jgi:hypothetical protein
VNYYTPWCTALSHERSRLEYARDARAGNLVNAIVKERFDKALIAFDQALVEHQNETGCEKRH